MIERKSELTFACVYVKGNVPFTSEYVTRLHSMLMRRVDREFNFVCLTDRPAELPEYETIGIETPKGYSGWWSKVQLFNPHIDIPGDRIVYLDLDTIIVSPINQIIDYNAPFALVPHEGNFQPNNGTITVPRYNSSVMVWNRNYIEVNSVFHHWSPQYTPKKLWGDQDLIGEVLPNEKTMPLAWFPRISALLEYDKNQLRTSPEAKVVLCKKPKNKTMMMLYPWFNEVWQ